MNIEDWAYLVENCKFAVSEDWHIVYEPMSDKAKDRIEKIVKDNQMENISVLDFEKINKQMKPLYLARKDLKKHQFFAMSTQEVAALPIEQKVEYMELLFPEISGTAGEQREKIDKIADMCAKNEANIKACLFHMDFPKSFWEEEKKKADRYAALIAKQPEIVEKMKNWTQTTLEEKKNVIKKATQVFEHVYGAAPKIVFFKEEEQRLKNKASGIAENVHIDAARSGGGAIYFNVDRLQSSDNFFAVSVVFHEGIHFRQENETFSDALVDRIMKCHTNYTKIYEDRLNNKESSTYKDLYAMQPHEMHAYGLQEYVENRLTELTGIQKTDDVNSDETKRIHNKAFSMAKVAQYRSSQK